MILLPNAYILVQMLKTLIMISYSRTLKLLPTLIFGLASFRPLLWTFSSRVSRLHHCWLAAVLKLHVPVHKLVTINIRNPYSK